MFSDKVKGLSRLDSVQRPFSTVGFFVKTQSLAEQTAQQYEGFSLIEFNMAQIKGAPFGDSVTLVTRSTSGSVPDKFVDPKQDSLVSSSSSGQLGGANAEGMFAHITFFGGGNATPTVTGYFDKRQPVNSTVTNPLNDQSGLNTPLAGNLPWDQMNSKSPLKMDHPSSKDITNTAAKDPVAPKLFDPKTGKNKPVNPQSLKTSQGTNALTGTTYVPTGMFMGYFK